MYVCSTKFARIRAHSCHAESWTRTVEGIERGRDVCFCDREAETGGWRVGGGVVLLNKENIAFIRFSQK